MMLVSGQDMGMRLSLKNLLQLKALLIMKKALLTQKEQQKQESFLMTQAKNTGKSLTYQTKMYYSYLMEDRRFTFLRAKHKKYIEEKTLTLQL